MNGFSALIRAFQTPKGMLAGGWLIVLILIAVFAPRVTSYDYAAQDLPGSFTAPNGAHWLGTDEFGRDLMTRIFLWRAHFVVGVLDRYQHFGLYRHGPWRGGGLLRRPV